MAIFGTGVKVGYDWAGSKMKDRLIAEMQLASDQYEIRLGELAQCRAQVDEFNLSVAKQERQIRELREASELEREANREIAAQRDAEIEEANARVRASLEALKGQINDIELSPCAGAVADRDLMRLLNTAIRDAGTGGPESPGD